MALPTIVIVHAAAQPPPIYSVLASALEHAGFSVIVPALPSTNPPARLTDNAADVALIHRTVSDLVDIGKDVIVLVHSYGGVVGTAALAGLGKKKPDGQATAGGVLRVVYVAAFALREGEQIPGAGDLEGPKAYGTYDEKNDTLLLSPEAAIYTCFHELAAVEAERLVGLTAPQSVAAMWTAQGRDPAWAAIPSTYVFTTQDRVIPVAQQEAMVAAARELCPTAFDVTVRLDTGHNPVLTKVDELVELVREAAGGATM